MDDRRLTTPTFPTAAPGVRVIRPAAALLCAAALLLAAAADAQRGRRQRQAQFSDTATVTVVEVPVQVISSGDPLRGLTRNDFELLDGRRPVEITGFDVVDLSTLEGKPTEEPVPAAARRHFLLLFDLFFTTPDSVGRAQQAAADLVLTELHPTDLVALAVYDTRPRLVLGFTSDRSQIRQAIRSLGKIETGEAIRDPLGLVVGDLSGNQPTNSDLGGAAGAAAAVDADSMLSQALRELQNLQGTAERGRAASHVAALTAGMGELAAWMQSVEGRKHVVFLSEGFDSSILVGQQGMTGSEQADILERQEAVTSGRSWEVDNEVLFGSSSAQNTMNRMLSMFREANCSIQAVDVSGEVQTEGQSNRASLFMMANDTGGEMFANFGNLGDAMSEVLDRTSVTYLLAFQPRDLKYDGKFNRLRVRIKDAPRGTRVVHRPGYYAPKPYAETSPFERAMSSAQQVMGGVEAGEIDTTVLSAGFAADSGKAYAPVLIEARGEDLLAGLQGGTLPLQIYAYALDEHGIVRDFFVRAMGLDAGQAGPALRQSGLKYWGHFDLDPGEYSVRVLLRNDATGRRALSTSVLQVPGSTPALQPPLFPEQPGKWVLLREEESEQRRDVAFPFLRSGEPFIPAARPEVTAGGETPISLVGMNLGAGPVSVRTQVFDSDGQQVADGGEIVLAPGAQAGSGLSQLSGVFIAGRKLSAGDYTLSVVVTDQANQELSSSTPIRVL
ncbi:MAG: VWA domain-containing protein [Acidobacteria bacterium]|nr:VWA domain-containing protein [Acidobacteriota bacterium]MYH23901.1 VWA domain-containing protein [Holophagales bacterium]